jgi:hypothetical protein
MNAEMHRDCWLQANVKIKIKIKKIGALIAVELLVSFTRGI